MGADPPRHPLIRNFIWRRSRSASRRRARVPVFLVVDQAA